VPEAQCQIDIPKGKDSESPELTVGKVFFVRCDGDWPAVEPAQVQLPIPEADQHKLKLLGFEFTSKSQAQLTVTSYKPGSHQLKNLQLKVGDQNITLSDLQFTVKSVINPQEPPPEPYGPVGPFQLPLPLWYLLGFFLILLLAAGFSVYRWRVRAEKKRLLSEMRLQEMVQEPFFQFYSTVRKLQRSSFNGTDLTPEQSRQVVSELNEAFKIYVARHFQIPTLKWPERKVLSDLKRNHPEFYKEFRAPLKQALAELSRAQHSDKQMLLKDCEQLAHLLRAQVDRMDLWLKRERRP
jgi:hypothetical protein